MGTLAGSVENPGVRRVILRPQHSSKGFRRTRDGRCGGNLEHGPLLEAQAYATYVAPVLERVGLERHEAGFVPIFEGPDASIGKDRPGRCRRPHAEQCRRVDQAALRDEGGLLDRCAVRGVAPDDEIDPGTA